MPRLPRLPRPRPIRYVMGGPKATTDRSTWRLNYSKQASKSGHGGVLRAVGRLVDRQGAFQQRPGRRRLPSGLQVNASAVEQPGGRARLDRAGAPPAEGAERCPRRAAGASGCCRHRDAPGRSGAGLPRSGHAVPDQPAPRAAARAGSSAPDLPERPPEEDRPQGTPRAGGAARRLHRPAGAGSREICQGASSSTWSGTAPSLSSCSRADRNNSR